MRYFLELIYSNKGRGRFLSHLETLSSIQRVIRMAKIPVVYSQGFSPQEKIIMPPPLPVGAIALADPVLIETTRFCEKEELKALENSLPALLHFIGTNQNSVEKNPYYGIARFRVQAALTNNLPPWAQKSANGKFLEFQLSPKAGSFPSLRKALDELGYQSDDNRGGCGAKLEKKEKDNPPQSLEGVARLGIETLWHKNI